LLHEEVNRESMQLAAKVGKLTYEEIKKALEKLIAELKTDIHKAQHPDPTHGKQSLKELAAQNAGLSSIELTDPNLRQLDREMKKCGIDFAPVKSGKGTFDKCFLTSPPLFAVVFYYMDASALVVPAMNLSNTGTLVSLDKKQAMKGGLLKTIPTSWVMPASSPVLWAHLMPSPWR